ncbi:MAG TPA: DUF805 domain-containing protein [Actinomycetota bacterium]
MGFGDAIRTCLSKYADFHGRAGRPEFWWFFLATWLIGTVIYLLAGAADSAFLWLIGGVISLALLLPYLAVLVRRLHDTGRSGWWYFISLIPLVGFIILVVFLATEGQPGQNEYGPPPGGAAMGEATPPPPPPSPA